MPITTQMPRRGALARRVSAAATVALREAVTYWHANMMPPHFTPGGAAKYGYAKRTSGYMRRKARRKGHQKPLRWSGESEDAAKTDYAITSKTIAGLISASVAMRMPSYFVQHPANASTSIDKPAELTRTTPDEEQRLNEVFERGFARELGMNRAIA